MLNFEFSTPTKIIFGKGTHGEVGKEIKEKGIGIKMDSRDFLNIAHE